LVFWESPPIMMWKIKHVGKLIYFEINLFLPGYIAWPKLVIW